MGKMPIPNGFLKKEELKTQEKIYELTCMFCTNCGLVQLRNIVSPKLMFKNYIYIPSTAKTMMNNFNSIVFNAHQIINLDAKRLVVDIGSNDGSLLKLFKNYGVKVVGIDPAENLAKVARMQGIETLPKLFNTKIANEVIKKYGQADVITATNVIAHIDDLHETFRGIEIVLKKDGVFITEFPYLLDLIHKNQFDTIYHEHLSYFSLKPWKRLLDMYGYKIIEVKRISMHGGSIRLIHTKVNNKQKESRAVQYLTKIEEDYGLYREGCYEKFTKRIYQLKTTTQEKLNDLKKQRKRIVGYGAAAKGNVLTNFFSIGNETLDYIVDSTPYKQGLFTPGKHIPIYPERRLIDDVPDYILILAWNFSDEIIKKQHMFKKRGGKFIIPLPDIKVV